MSRLSRTTRRVPRPLRQKLLLSAGAVVVALLASEVVLRTQAPLHSYYAGHDTVPALRERFYRALFPSSYRGEQGFLQRFVAGEEDRKRYDPELGWDLDPAHGRQRAPFAPVARPAPDDPARRTRIVCIGDSFTFGADVEPTASFPCQLGELLDVETINLGVPGYGIDQAILKEERYGAAFEPDLVVLGVYRSDYTRASIGFTAFAKPKVVHDASTDRRVVVDDHIRAPTELIHELRADAFWSSRLIALLRSRLAASMRSEATDRAYHDRMDRVVGHLLAGLRDRLAARGTPLLIVQIPSQADFATPRNHSFAMRSPLRQRLLALYERLGLPCLDVTARLAEEFPFEQVHQHLFVQLPNGANAHLSRAGNRVVARWIATALRDGTVPTDHFPSAPDYRRLAAETPLARSANPIETIAHWPLDFSSVDRETGIARDAGPHGLHARVVDAGFTAEGTDDLSVWFDGEVGELVVPSAEPLQLGDRFEITARIRPDPLGLHGSRAIIGKGGSFSLSLRDGQPAFYGHGLAPEAWHVGVGARLEAGRWYDIEARLSSGRLRLRLNSETILDRFVGGSVCASNLPLKIGRAQGRFAGRIDRVELRRP